MLRKGGLEFDRRALRAERESYREDYHGLSDAELRALLWAATSEHQRRHGDGLTTHMLAHLAENLPTMAREVDR